MHVYMIASAPEVAPAIGEEALWQVPQLLLLALAGRDGWRPEVGIRCPCPISHWRLHTADCVGDQQLYLISNKNGQVHTSALHTAPALLVAQRTSLSHVSTGG